MNVTRFLKSSVKDGEVRSTVDGYAERFQNNTTAGVKERLRNASRLTDEYYSLVTDFYLNAWGRMFHFGMRKKGERFKESLLRHEYYLADKLHLIWNEKCLDIGCGVGGPMINIAKRFKVSITGVNNSAYQVMLGKNFLRKEGLESTCSFIECDWMKIPLPAESFDKAYTIEATCHASDNRKEVFKEIYRLLKPGALFAGYDWVMTENFDEMNPNHLKLKHNIEVGNGLSNLNFRGDVTQALEEAGFEVVECRDMAETCDPETPWYLPLKGESRSIQLIRMSPFGRMFMRNIMRVLESIRILPKGTLKVSKLLNVAGEALVKAGEENIFTPMLFFLAKKKSAKSVGSYS